MVFHLTTGERQLLFRLRHRGLSTTAIVKEVGLTWSYSGQVVLAESVALVDHGDTEYSDSPDILERLRSITHTLDERYALHLVLSGDDVATPFAPLPSESLHDWGLITLDAHLDLQDCVSNGSPVRQLFEIGMPGTSVVWAGHADFSNSAAHAKCTAARASQLSRATLCVANRSSRDGASTWTLTSTPPTRPTCRAVRGLPPGDSVWTRCADSRVLSPPIRVSPWST